LIDNNPETSGESEWYMNGDHETWAKKYQPMDDEIFKLVDKLCLEHTELEAMLDAIDAQKEDKANSPYWTVIGNASDPDYKLHQNPDQVSAWQDAQEQEINVRERMSQILSGLDLLGDERLIIGEAYEREISETKTD
jgi:hypothetical protein